MNFFVENRFQRESISSSLSKDSIDSQSSNSFGYKIENNQTKEKISCSEHFLFFGPLILFLILLISGIIVFIIIQQQTFKHGNKDQFYDQFSNEDFLPLSCSLGDQYTFVHNQLKCGLNRSSIFHIYYSNNHRPIKSGENLTIEDIIDPPKIKLNYGFLSKIYTKSFVLILIDPEGLGMFLKTVILHWIRYYSSSLDDAEDICSYKKLNYSLKKYSEHIFLLYATNSSQITLRAKTICNVLTEWFRLNEYINFAKLTLIASTNIFISSPQQSFSEK